MRTLLALSMLVFAPLAATAQEAPEAPPLQVRLYPVLIQAPIYGATVNVPSIPGGGGGSEGGVVETASALNSAYMGGVEFYANRVFGEVDLLWAKPSASHDATPKLNVNTELWAWTFKGGFRLFKGLGVTGGARRISLGLDTSLEFPASGLTLQGSRTLSVWNPFLGVDWRGRAGRKWTFDLATDVGVAAGTDSHARLRARVDWEPIPHLALRFGYQFLHLELSTDQFTLGTVTRTLTTRQNMYGPEVGLGFVF